MAKKAAMNARKAKPAAKKEAATRHTNRWTYGLTGKELQEAIAHWNDPYNPDHRWIGEYAELHEEALKGKVPPPPDFSADTHARFRTKLATLVALAKKRDVAGLRAMQINPVSTSPIAMWRYRNLALIALEAPGKKRAAQKAAYQARQAEKRR
jgi:hypothetical protein